MQAPAAKHKVGMEAATTRGSPPYKRSGLLMLSIEHDVRMCWDLLERIQHRDLQKGSIASSEVNAQSYELSRQRSTSDIVKPT